MASLGTTPGTIGLRRLIGGIGVAAALAITLAACGPDVTSPSTSSPSPSSQPPLRSITGTVSDFTTGQPRRVPNLRLLVRTSGPDAGPYGGTPLPDLVTDAEGRYAMSEIQAWSLYFETAPETEYTFLCPLYPVSILSPAFAWNIGVVHRTWSGDRVPSGMLIPGTSVYGTVSERLGDRLEPISGAIVTLDTGLQDPPATTVSSGFYQVCSEVGTDQTRTITARKDGYHSVTREIFGGWDRVVNFELVRQ